ncbi:DUF3221 domain-containing protein [Niallia oryzisoli]|uniref:DUF3221 domain-containing protein n=1 Tax=Niallia oryzisoli TaxID=1737571 RepID=A0ABZ2C9R6_9BACI
MIVLTSSYKVEIWIKGGIQESYPAQAGASKIEVID